MNAIDTYLEQHPERIILGIDPSTVSTGWAIMSNTRGLIAYGAIRCSSKDPLHIRVHHIFEQLTEISNQHNITEVAVEDQFMQSNPKTLKALSNVKTTAMLTAAKLNIPYAEYAPMSIKRCFTGNGKASKEDMINTAKEKYKIIEDIRDDTADAIGIAYTHLTQGAR